MYHNGGVVISLRRTLQVRYRCRIWD